MRNNLVNQDNSFFRFCIVGAIGFVVDLGLLQLVLSYGYSPIEGRIVSILVALTVTWLLHRYFTFKQTDRRFIPQYSRYILVAVCGAGVNFVIYTGVLIATPNTPAFVALIIASAIALSANYLGSRYFAFS